MLIIFIKNKLILLFSNVALNWSKMRLKTLVMKCIYQSILKNVN